MSSELTTHDGHEYGLSTHSHMLYSCTAVRVHVQNVNCGVSKTKLLLRSCVADAMLTHPYRDFAIPCSGLRLPPEIAD